MRMITGIESCRDEQSGHNDYKKAIADTELFKVGENEYEREEKNEKEDGFIVVDWFQSFAKQIRCHQITPLFCRSVFTGTNIYVPLIA